MTHKHLLGLALCVSMAVFSACNSGGDKKEETNAGTNEPATSTSGGSIASEGSDPKGIGPHKNVDLTHPLDQKMVEGGKGIYDVKCSSCHKTTDEKLVGPGWKGVTDRRTPEWIMNFVTNTEEMIEKDTAAQNMLEVCLVKMPNQGLTEADARSVLEFMRNNDGKK
jgi:hypothetical protein